MGPLSPIPAECGYLCISLCASNLCICSFLMQMLRLSWVSKTIHHENRNSLLYALLLVDSQFRHLHHHYPAYIQLCKIVSCFLLLSLLLFLSLSFSSLSLFFLLLSKAYMLSSFSSPPSLFPLCRSIALFLPSLWTFPFQCTLPQHGLNMLQIYTAMWHSGPASWRSRSIEAGDGIALSVIRTTDGGDSSRCWCTSPFI